jgi:hypothetical protein
MRRMPMGQFCWLGVMEWAGIRSGFMMNM